MKCLICLTETAQVIDGDPICSAECCHKYSGVTCDSDHCNVDCPMKPVSIGATESIDDDDIMEF